MNLIYAVVSDNLKKDDDNNRNTEDKNDNNKEDERPSNEELESMKWFDEKYKKRKAPCESYGTC